MLLSRYGATETAAAFANQLVPSVVLNQQKCSKALIYTPNRHFPFSETAR